MKEPESNVHADHQEFAMGEIDDFEDPEDHGEPDTEQGINATEE
jgi:hypothetical protein